MADARIIAKRDVPQWIERMKAGAEVIGPVAQRGGDIAYVPLERPEEMAWRFWNSLSSPRDYLYPQTDTLLCFGRNGKGYEVRERLDTRQRVLFGIRNCDVSAIEFMDRIMSAFKADAPYLARRERTALVALACHEPNQEFCMCPCAGTGPFLDERHDVQLTDLGDAVLAEITTEKGRELIALGGDLFGAPTEAQRREKARLAEEALDKFGPIAYTNYVQGAMRRVSLDARPAEFWDQLADWCVECGGCTYICPTCNCFNMIDQMVDGRGERVRCWDSCQYEGMTREASAHNPRAAHRDRVKRRFYHKLSYQYQQRDGSVGCVCCGRCVAVCCGDLGIPVGSRAIRRGERS